MEDLRWDPNFRILIVPFLKILYPTVWRKHVKVKVGCSCNRTTWKLFLEQANRHNLVTWMVICPLLAVFHAQAAWGQLPIDETSPEGLHVVTSQVPIWGVSLGGGLFWFLHPLVIKDGCSWRISVLIGTTHMYIYIYIGNFPLPGLPEGVFQEDDAAEVATPLVVWRRHHV